MKYTTAGVLLDQSTDHLERDTFSRSATELLLAFFSADVFRPVSLGELGTRLLLPLAPMASLSQENVMPGSPRLSINPAACGGGAWR